MEILPKWAEVILIPFISLILSFLISALVIIAIGEDPIAALKLMIKGNNFFEFHTIQSPKNYKYSLLRSCFLLLQEIVS